MDYESASNSPNTRSDSLAVNVDSVRNWFCNSLREPVIREPVIASGNSE